MGSQADLSKGCRPQRPVLFFDIDNCLYSRDAKIFDLVSDLIDEYFEKHLSLTREEAVKLHHQYHTDYGHSIEGLVRHHKIDPIEYNAQVDDALPLEDILKPDVQLRKLLEDVDTSKVRLWLLTNAKLGWNQFRIVTSSMTLTGIASALRRLAGQRLTFLKEGFQCPRKKHRSIKYKVWRSFEISFLSSSSLELVLRPHDRSQEWQ
ncbi:Suppressor of disruption of TFIIS [Colletotrichum fructicola Nara gc5]|uniref:Suppressor of disruption of TFIIS n=1 Tax=Colletotrichum fructicola (strain Nara gc5) TaxID=1213859 RepID=A0A7J6JBQ5_COLFN|nr:Suppressor of disruption of TFIIS [Colletotrichum fructicola Nara gc5]